MTAIANSTGLDRPPLKIIRIALRGAEPAPTVYDALDVNREALRRLAKLARAQVRHG